jgi:hypothetical protein
MTRNCQAAAGRWRIFLPADQVIDDREGARQFGQLLDAVEQLYGPAGEIVLPRIRYRATRI